MGSGLRSDGPAWISPFAADARAFLSCSAKASSACLFLASIASMADDVSPSPRTGGIIGADAFRGPVGATGRGGVGSIGFGGGLIAGISPFTGGGIGSGSPADCPGSWLSAGIGKGFITPGSPAGRLGIGVGATTPSVDIGIDDPSVDGCAMASLKGTAAPLVGTGTGGMPACATPAAGVKNWNWQPGHIDQFPG